MTEYSTIAAVDLGSNSFRLQVSRVEDGQIYPLDSLKDTVRLASGLRPDKFLDDASQVRALTCLRRFGERLRGLAPEEVRAVATNTLRVAKNAPALLREAEEALGFPIEVIAGHEEARLIYLGVAHAFPRTGERRLVVDIGGGSTEFIIGVGYKPLRVDSLYMGCVSYTARFFPDGRITPRAMRTAELAAAAELQTITGEFSSGHWAEAIGSSGTARALFEISEQNGLSTGGITADGLERLRALVLKAGDARRLTLPGLREDRAPVLPGGLAIMTSVFRELGIQRMTTTESGLREGVLYEMLGRFQHKDTREATVRQFMHRYHVDQVQAARVESLALTFYRLLAPPEKIAERDIPYLTWAARLHEIGISIAYSGFHKHSAYIIENADMPGFSRPEQARMAVLLQAQRGGLAKVAARVASEWDWMLILCLRLAVVLHRGRSDLALPAMDFVRRGEDYDLVMDGAWLDANTLSEANLESEVKGLAGVGITLRLTRQGDSAATMG